MLGKIAADFNRIGINTIRKQTEDKARQVYRFLETNSAYSPFVTEERHRSQTVLVAKTNARPAAEVIAAVKKSGMILGSGYGNFKEGQIRIANFPATTADQVGALLNQLKAIE